MPKPTKAEIVVTKLLDGIWAEWDLDSGYPKEINEQILKVRSEIVAKYPDIYQMNIEEGV
jgi:hypothetical protein